MNENPSTDQELENTIQRILDAETDNFFELAEMLGRDPKQDLAGADLHDCDLSNGDLQGANLRKTDLTNANLSGTDLRNADLTGANLTGANLTNAQLDGILVEDALFSQNQGLTQDAEDYLMERGAVFEDAETLILEPIYQYEPSFLGFLRYTFLGKREESRQSQELIPRIARVKVDNESGPKDIVVDFSQYLSKKEESRQLQEPIPRIARIKIDDESDQSQPPFDFIMIMLSWLLAITFLAILGYIFYQALILNSEKANVILYHAFTLILGCFIGALTTYLKMASEQKS